MKIYISGKISGLDHAEAKAKFAAAAEYVRSKGHEAFNPMEGETAGDNKTWQEYMLADIEQLFTCDAIYLLSDWMDSRGARIEAAIAMNMPIAVFLECDGVDECEQADFHIKLPIQNLRSDA